MAVVIRLQGLQVTAGSEDIRKFFSGLKIPDGGVHIIGGVEEEAFIIFASDEDARRAMARSGGLIRGSAIRLLLSSKTEMQNVLERTTLMAELAKREFEDDPPYAGRSGDRRMDKRMGGQQFPIGERRDLDTKTFFIVFLNGMPFSVTHKEIHKFFEGLQIEEIILLKNHRGQNNGKGFVRFSSSRDALESLKKNRDYIGTRYVEVCTTTVDEWQQMTGRLPGALDSQGLERDRSSVPSQRFSQRRSRSRSPIASKRSHASEEEYCVLLKNVSFTAEKGDIKQMFHNATLDDDQILYINDDGRRSKSALVLFKSFQEYRNALSREKRQFQNRWIDVSPISRENMLALLESQSLANKPESTRNLQERAMPYQRGTYDTEKVCLLVKNLPFDVRKVEIIDFFHEFNVAESKVTILRDDRGSGAGQALVLFQSEAQARDALCLNGRRFLGLEVALKCISRSQMKELIANTQVPQDSSRREDWYPNRRSRSSETSFQPDNRMSPNFRSRKDSALSKGDMQGFGQGGGDFEAYSTRPRFSRDRGNGDHGDFDSSERSVGGPTCVQLLNLPYQISSEEIYDFCYGYRIIPGSVSLQYDQQGNAKGSATLVFESRQEATTAVNELNGRPIGPRKIKLMLL